MCNAASGTSLVPTRYRSSSRVTYSWASSVGRNPVPYIASSRTSTGGITGVNPLAIKMSSACRTSANCTSTMSPIR